MGMNRLRERSGLERFGGREYMHGGTVSGEHEG